MKKFSKTILAAAFIAGASSNPAMAQLATVDTYAQCGQVDLVVYFSLEDASLTDVALAALEENAPSVDGCEISGIETAAISTDGDASLSEARSNAVLTALADIGIAPTETRTEIASAGQGRIISTARRVEVTLTSLPGTITS